MLLSTVGGCSPHGSLSPFNIETFRGICAKGGHLLMITIETIYYFVAITGIMCGAAYKLGYENGKNARK